MRNFISIMAISLLGIACDSNDQDERGGNVLDKGDKKVAEELAADLKICTKENAAQDAVDCARDLLSALEEVSPRCANYPPPKPTCDKNGSCKIPAPKADEP